MEKALTVEPLQEGNLVVLGVVTRGRYVHTLTSVGMQTHVLKLKGKKIEMSSFREQTTSGVIGLTKHEGDLMFVYKDRVSPASGRKLGDHWVIHDNKVFLSNEEWKSSKVVFEVPRNNYVYHLRLKGKRLEVNSVDLFGVPVLTTAVFSLQLDDNDCPIRIKEGVRAITLEEPVTCITSSEMYTVVGGKRVRFYSGYNREEEPFTTYDDNEDGTIDAMGMFENVLVYTKRRVMTMLFIEHGEVVNVSETITPSVFTNVEITSRDFVVGYNSSHLPFVWRIDQKLCEVGYCSKGVESGLVGCSAMSSNVTAITDGYTSQLKMAAGMTSRRISPGGVDWVGVMANGMLLARVSDTKYEIWNEFRVLKRVKFKERIVDINEEYIVTEGGNIYWYSIETMEIVILKEFEYELYQFNGGRIILYNCGKLKCIEGGEVIKEEDIDFSKKSTLTLSVSWEGEEEDMRVEIGLGNLVKLYEYSFEFNSRTFGPRKVRQFESCDDKIVIWDGIPRDGIYIGEDFTIFDKFKRYGYGIGFQFIEIHEFNGFTMLGLTVDYKLVVVYKSFCVELKEFGKVMQVIPRREGGEGMFFIIGEHGVYRYGNDSGRFISKVMDDVVLKIGGSEITPFVVMMKSIGLFNTITKEQTEIVLNGCVVEVGEEFEGEKTMIRVVVFNRGECSERWFESKLGDLVETTRTVRTTTCGTTSIASVRARARASSGTTLTLSLGDTRDPFNVCVWKDSVDMATGRRTVIDTNLCVWRVV